MKKYIILTGGIVGIATTFFLGATFLVSAQNSTSTIASGTSSLGGIAFPIPELGNCASKDECRVYCNDPANIDACISFGKAHGLLSQDEASSSQKFAQAIQNGGGPGGCATPDACKTYCSDVSHIDVCLAFAKQLGIKNSDTSQAEKISAYIAGGGTMPGGCTSKESCQAYCSDFSHADECLAFAQKLGLPLPGGPNASSTAPGQFQKFLELVKNGQTPGGCTSKDACEAYCKDTAHFEECLAFAKSAGLVSSSTAQGFEAAGGKGPGGCDSAAACESYCNDPAHRDECFTFAKDHGFLSQGQLDNAEQGLNSLRAGLERMSPDVASCVTSALGADVVQQIESGTLTPGPDIGQKIKACYDQFGAQKQFSNPFANIPPQAAQCVKDKLGNDFSKIQSGSEHPTPEMADAVRVCFESLQFGGNSSSSMQGNGGPGIPPSQFLKTAPPEITQCLKDKLGSVYDDLLATTTLPTGDVKQAMESCFQSFRPQTFGQQSGSSTGQFGKPPMGEMNGMMPQQNGFMNLPPAVKDCVAKTLGSDALQSLEGGNQATPEEDQAIKSCFESTQPQPGSMPQNGTQSQTAPAGNAPDVAGFSKLPPEVAACVKAKVGSDLFDKVSAGTAPISDIVDALRGCVQGQASSSPNFPPPPQPASSGTAQYPGGDTSGGQYPSGGSYQMPPPSGGTPPPPSGTTTACPAGQFWNGSACVDPAQQCAEHGGTWTGSTCAMPPMTQPSSLLPSLSGFSELLQVFSPILGI